MRLVMLFEQSGQDLKLAWRRLGRAGGFTATAVLTLAVGIGGTTAMFALVEGVLLRPLPVRAGPAGRRLEGAAPTGFAHWPFRAHEVEVIRDESRVLESVAGVSYYEHPRPFATIEDGRASSIIGAAVTGDFFRVLGAEPLLGRALAAPTTCRAPRTCS